MNVCQLTLFVVTGKLLSLCVLPLRKISLLKLSFSKMLWIALFFMVSFIMFFLMSRLKCMSSWCIGMSTCDRLYWFIKYSNDLEVY